MKRKTLYTTSEYLDALELQEDGNLYNCKGKDFQFFSNKGAAQYDAQWLVKHHTDKGEIIKMPIVYKVKLERV